MQGFSKRQLDAIALQAHVVGTGIATGNITGDLQELFLDGLKDIVRSFVRVLRGLMMVTFEKVWNAVVGVVWNAISKATGLVRLAP